MKCRKTVVSKIFYKTCSNELLGTVFFSFFNKNPYFYKEITLKIADYISQKKDINLGIDTIL
ncbi:hypothetical protein LEP1GSC072_3594 [Leptospira noguchii str. Bonito]|nr:hypothetical protein LEP1GSC072_3594 [Leptospira noguchii str. Bonito]